MLDALLHKWTGPVADAAARRLAWNPLAAAFAAFALGLAALPVIGMHYYLPGLALLVLSRSLAGLAAATARGSEAANRLALICVFDSVVIAGLPFAFALGDPARALACVFLVFALSVNIASAFAFAKGDGPARGGIWNTEIIIAIAFACVFPEHFAIVAYVLGVLCFVASGARVAAGIAERKPS
jgi:hypothetical protein